MRFRPLPGFTLAAPFLTTLVLAGCNSPLDPGELAGLVTGERRWAARPFADYSFEMQRFCFCANYGTVRATVVDGVVVALEALDADNPELAPLPEPSAWPTIEALFRQIRHLAQDGTYRDLEVKFDATLGYPTWFEAHADEALDAGFTYEVHAVHGLD